MRLDGAHRGGRTTSIRATALHEASRAGGPHYLPKLRMNATLGGAQVRRLRTELVKTVMIVRIILQMFIHLPLLNQNY